MTEQIDDDRLKELLSQMAEPVAPLDDQAVTELARNVVTNKVYLRFMGTPGWDESFGALAALNGLSMIPRNAVGMYEFWDKASPRGLNGYPMFFSGMFLCAENVDRFWSEYERMKEALG